MRTRLFASAMGTGHVARDYIRLVHQTRTSSAGDSPPRGPGAQEVLGSFEDHYRPIPVEPGPPVKTLVTILTRDLQGIPSQPSGDRNEIGARLFRGCRVRMIGIPERHFVVHEVFWDYGEVRIKEVGRDTQYVVPWDCLELHEK